MEVAEDRKVSHLALSGAMDRVTARVGRGHHWPDLCSVVSDSLGKG